MAGTWVYVDHFKGTALPASYEAIAAAKNLGGPVTALIFGQGVDALAHSAFHYGADAVLLGEDASLADYRAEAYASLLSKLAKEQQPDAVLFPTSSRAREIAAIVAIDLDTGVLVDVTEISQEGEGFVATHPIYAGKLLSKVTVAAKPALVTLRGRAFGKPVADASRSGTVTKVAAAVAEGDLQTKVVDYATVEGRVSLADAAVIVS
ncbi:MAG: hypothetical protein KIT07_10145, partial [Anaerolineales bacterium]|nr:hypothetical protein [Anaerolineales bacterium]